MYLDLLVYRSNARSNKIPFLFAFLQAVQIYTLDPLINFNSKVPLANLFLPDDDVQGGIEDEFNEDDGVGYREDE